MNMKRILAAPVFLFCLSVSVFAQDPVLIIRETEEKTGEPISIAIGSTRLEPIKDINGINQGPMLKASNDDYRENWFSKLGITIWRSHDMAADSGLNPYDLNHIFPIETADPSKRENYDFSTTDAAMKQMSEFGVKTLWRMGSTIENMDEYHYEVNPPKSAKIWAEAAANVLEHYAKGKWDGFHYDIPYVEIWNEPNNKHCWTGSKEEFIDFYITAAKIIKKRCPWIKVGGPAFSNPWLKTVKPFIDACALEDAPLDFFSVHWYVYTEGDDSRFITPSDNIRKWLDAAGYTDTEIFLDEWHPIKGWKNVNPTLDHDWSVLTASVMLGFQDSNVDKAFFYTGSATRWGYAQEGVPGPVYYAAKAVGELRAHNTRLDLQSTGLPDGSRVLASEDDEGNAAVLLALYKGGKRQVSFDWSALGTFKEAELFLFDDNHNLEKIASLSAPDNCTMNVNTGCESSLLLLKLRKEGGGAPCSAVRITPGLKGRLKALSGGNSGPSLKSKSVHFKTRYYPGMHIPVTRVSSEYSQNLGIRLISTNHIFPLQTADPSDRSFYDFRASDDYIAQIKAGGSDVFWCLTAADERFINRQHFRISPPDTEKWKRVCENIIRHYNEGQWNGKKEGIVWWEIWDEPDNPAHWSGTLEQYFDLYTKTASYLKARFPDILVGGPSFGDPTDEKVAAFLSACKKEGAPLDFFSYKLFNYAKGDYDRFACSPVRLRSLLDEAGFKDTRIVLSSWHPVRGSRLDIEGAKDISWASLCASLMCEWQNRPMDMAMFESTNDGPGGVYTIPKPNPFYYIFVAFADLAAHGNLLSLETEGLGTESRALAGTDENGNVDVLLALHGEGSRSTMLDFSALGNFSHGEVLLMDKAVEKLSTISSFVRPGGKIELNHPNPDAIILVKLYK